MKRKDTLISIYVVLRFIKLFNIFTLWMRLYCLFANRAWGLTEHPDMTPLFSAHKLALALESESQGRKKKKKKRGESDTAIDGEKLT